LRTCTPIRILGGSFCTPPYWVCDASHAGSCMFVFPLLLHLIINLPHLSEASGTLASVGFLQVRGIPIKCREMPSCYAGSVPKSSSGPPRGASWVTLTTEGAQARNWRYNQWPLGPSTSPQLWVNSSTRVSASVWHLGGSRLSSSELCTAISEGCTSEDGEQSSSRTHHRNSGLVWHWWQQAVFTSTCSAITGGCTSKSVVKVTTHSPQYS